MQLRASAGQRLTEPVQVAVVILFAEKARFAVMAALYDVQRLAGEMDARAAGHARSLWGLGN